MEQGPAWPSPVQPQTIMSPCCPHTGICTGMCRKGGYRSVWLWMPEPEPSEITMQGVGQTNSRSLVPLCFMAESGLRRKAISASLHRDQGSKGSLAPAQPEFREASGRPG
ncbi:hypothetical protein KIL84_022537 [Mauremys mutica]|uniref:Uncharacterized protein n=1 Tax=Mauremys mutica TaxID=74926 RepID=A0A9D3WPJ5_9SAUR|nr:hypothetical protein KIL84_022537 [Mauremys mutica]